MLDPDTPALHSWQTQRGSGLPHDPIASILGPRPIGWISTCDAKGHAHGVDRRVAPVGRRLVITGESQDLRHRVHRHQRTRDHAGHVAEL